MTTKSSRPSHPDPSDVDCGSCIPKENDFTAEAATACSMLITFSCGIGYTRFFFRAAK